jgi:exodeoxyribonuclease-5
MSVTFNDQQNTAIELIDNFLKSDEQVFSLQGYAGTGKTTVMTSLAQTHRNWKQCAFTGKAASVLAKKSGLPASTIHSLFYRFVENKTDVQGKVTPIFKKIHAFNSLGGTVVSVDESSMINVEMAADLLISGAKIITSGDPMQLQPVTGVQAFTKADILFTEVHRQAQNSPIIRQATKVRENADYAEDGDGFQIKKILSDDNLMEMDIILCFTNATRRMLNNKMRAIHNYNGSPKAGEPLVCLMNAKQYGLYNGEVYTLAQDYNNSNLIVIFRDQQKIIVPKIKFITGTETASDYFKSGVTTVFDFGYALTVHKAQGSEWNKVGLIDECHRDCRQHWLYTGITRAAEQLIVQRA